MPLDNLCISPIELFTIENNPNLSVCNNPCLCTHLLQGGQSIINGNSQGCNTRDEIIASCLVKSIDPELISDIQVLPNPTFQYLEIKGLASTSFQYSILDVFGNLLIKDVANLPILDLGQLPGGLYILLIKDENKITLDRIVKF